MTFSLTLLPSSGADQAPFCCHMVVGKALLNRPPTKQLTEGQIALESFLARRRQKYQARRNGSAKDSCEEDKETERFYVHQRNSVIRLVSLKEGPRPLIRPTRTLNPSSPIWNAKETKLEDFSRLECEVLADRVVSQAKVRLKRRKRAANVLQKIYKPLSDSKVSTFRTSTPTNSKSSTPKSLSPSKNIQRLNRSLEVESGGEERRGLKAVRKVVFWSEKQSAMTKDSGVPCVPPPSPKPDLHQEAEDTKFVPSMSDIKSQRRLKHCLQAITEKDHEDADKQLARKMEKERREAREATKRLKAQQRAEIYALNKVMAEFEKLKFESVMSGKV